ncbi:serine protease 1-like isoform X2 [Oculina patagonica]
MLSVAVFCVLALGVPFSQGNEFNDDKDEIRGVLNDDLRLLKEFNVREKRAVCEDKSSYCSSYKNYCKDPSYKDYLEKNCKETCDFCGEECLDRIDCKRYISYCDNKKHTTSMKYYCSKTCGFCQVATAAPPPTTVPRTEQPIDQGSVECGTKAQGTRIVGGTNAKPGAWPWQITMDYKGHAEKPHWCGGSIVSPQWIVSAAHCFAYGDDPNQYTIVAGDHDLNGKEGYEQNIPIEKIIKHPQYAAHKNHDYDLALIKLKSPLTYNNRVRPVCLPKFDFDVGTNCFVTGWGHTEEGGDIPQILQQAKIPLISRDSCQNAYRDLGYTISQRMRCAGYAKGGIDACQGDSGGPMVCSKNDKWYLMGAVSWGIGCAREGRYGVYADLMDLKYWVQETINGS